MLNKIFKDLKDNVKKIYKSRVISISKLVHHSLNYPDFKDLIKKYSGDSEYISQELYAYINQYESPEKDKKKINAFNNEASQFNDVFKKLNKDFYIEFDSLNEKDDNNIFQTEDIHYFFEIVKSFEIQRLTRMAQETGQIAQPDDLSLDSFLRALIQFSEENKNYAFLYKIIKDSKFNIEKFKTDFNLGKSNKKSLIKELCTNLNQKALDGKIQEVIGRDLEIEQLTNILKKARKNNPILVGNAGVGKTAIVEGLAKKIIQGDIPDSLSKAVIYELRVMDIVKGTSFRGQFEQKMSDLLVEFKEKEESGNEIPILFIDEIHTIMGAGSSGNGGLDFSNIIKPALARGELRTIGATTTDEWYKFIKDNPALDRRFISVTVKEPSFEDSLKILKGSISFYEKNHGVKYEKGTIERAIELSQQFISDNSLPDKAFDLIDYSGAMCAVKRKTIVSVDDIEYALARHKNIDLEAIMQSRKDNIKEIAPQIKKFIFGQDEAVDIVSRSVEKSIAGLNQKDKPYGAFLFTGPTGTGKTELAKQVAKVMKSYFYRADMSEFKEAHTISKLIGAPAGYVGYGDSSSLVKIVNENPRVVILLDEIEKAHPDVIKLFLQIMDYGKLTDSKGKAINFNNALIIMTSNAGVNPNSSQVIGISNNNNENSSINKSEVNSFFPPEFRARLSGNGPIEFKPLGKESLTQIVNKYINEIQLERLNKLNIKLTLSKNALDKLVELGMSKQLGARPIKDAIESNIIDQLTSMVLFGKLKDLKKEKEVVVLYKENKFLLDF